MGTREQGVAVLRFSVARLQHSDENETQHRVELLKFCAVSVLHILKSVEDIMSKNRNNEAGNVFLFGVERFDHVTNKKQSSLCILFHVLHVFSCSGIFC